MDSFTRYKKLQEKFGLPKLNDLKHTFKIELNNETEIFDQIRSEISDRLFTFSDRIIEPIIAGSESFCCLFEQNMITDEERKNIFEIYKKIQELKWQNNLLMIKPEEKETADWIRKTWTLWNSEMNDELSKLCRKLSIGWRDMRFKDEVVHYQG